MEFVYHKVSFIRHKRRKIMKRELVTKPHKEPKMLWHFEAQNGRPLCRIGLGGRAGNTTLNAKAVNCPRCLALLEEEGR